MRRAWRSGRFTRWGRRTGEDGGRARTRGRDSGPADLLAHARSHGLSGDAVTVSKKAESSARRGAGRPGVRRGLRGGAVGRARRRKDPLLEG